VRAGYRTVLERYGTLADGFELRLVTPVARLFPTVRTVVDALEHAGDQRASRSRGPPGW
jgi:hypothetical protein